MVGCGEIVYVRTGEKKHRNFTSEKEETTKGMVNNRRHKRTQKEKQQMTQMKLIIRDFREIRCSKKKKKQQTTQMTRIQ